MTEPLIDTALRDVASSDEFLTNLRKQASDLKQNGKLGQAAAVERVIKSVEEVRDFSAGTAERLEAQAAENESDLG